MQVLNNHNIFSPFDHRIRALCTDRTLLITSHLSPLSRLLLRESWMENTVCRREEWRKIFSTPILLQCWASTLVWEKDLSRHDLTRKKQNKNSKSFATNSLVFLVQCLLDIRNEKSLSNGSATPCSRCPSYRGCLCPIGGMSVRWASVPGGPSEDAHGVWMYQSTPARLPLLPSVWPPRRGTVWWP